jgi:hypothetical protein
MEAMEEQERTVKESLKRRQITPDHNIYYLVGGFKKGERPILSRRKLDHNNNRNTCRRALDLGRRQERMI